MKTVPPMITFEFFHTQSIKEIRVISDLIFLAFQDFFKTNQLSNSHLQTKTHHMKLFLGQNSYQLKIPKLDH